jgi:hypothetical protein
MMSQFQSKQRKINQHLTSTLIICSDVCLMQIDLAFVIIITVGFHVIPNLGQSNSQPVQKQTQKPRMIEVTMKFPEDLG